MQHKKGQKTARVILWAIFAGCVFLLLFTFTDLNRFLVAPLIKDDSPRQADVIIILGGGVLTDYKMLPWSVQERIKRGAELYNQGYAGHIIVTGGQVKGQPYSESMFMRQYAESLGVPKDAIIEEDMALDTHDNAVRSLSIMERQAWDEAIIVTSDYHTWRAERVFSKVGIDHTIVAAYPADGFAGNAFRRLMDTRSILRDYAAIVYYLVRGYL